MTDPSYKVILSAVHYEALKWEDLAGLMSRIKPDIDNLSLSPLAFFIGDLNTAPHYNAYEAFLTSTAELVSQASSEFIQMAGALDKIADGYERADDIVALDLSRIFPGS